MSTEFKNDSKVFCITNIGSIKKKVWQIVNCTFLDDMTHIPLGPTYISFICMTNKSVMTFFLSIKYLSVCLSGSTGSYQAIMYDTSSYFLNHHYIVRCNDE